MTSILERLDEHNDRVRRAAGAVAENERQQTTATRALDEAERELRDYQRSGAPDGALEAELVGRYTKLSNRRIPNPNGQGTLDVVLVGQREKLRRQQGETEADRLAFIKSHAKELQDALLAEAEAREAEMTAAIGHLQTVATAWDHTAQRWRPLREVQGIRGHDVPVNPVKDMLARIELVISQRHTKPAPLEFQNSQQAVTIDARTQRAPVGSAS